MEQSGIKGEWDMTTRDAQTISKAVDRWPKRWRGQTPEVKDGMVDLLKLAAEASRRAMAEAVDPKDALAAAAVAANLVRASAALEAQTQADEHLADKNARLDAGMATERIAIQPRATFQGMPDEYGNIAGALALPAAQPAGGDGNAGQSGTDGEEPGG